MPQLAERLRFYLADPLARDLKLAADFFERPAPTVLKTEAQAKYFALPVAEAVEDVDHLLFEELVGRGFGLCE